MKKTRLYVLPVLLVAMVLISGCTTQSGETIEPTGVVREFDITAQQWSFSPDTITVNAGDTVKLHITSADVTHGFALPTFGVNEVIEPGQDVHVEFIANRRGTFSFWCSVQCGSGHGGMSGQIIVE